MSDDTAEIRTAWCAHVTDSSAGADELDEVLGQHRRPDRRYHGVAHVTWVVRHVLDLAAAEAVADLGALVAAAVYHDAVYDPRASDNEEQSAAWAHRALVELGWPAPRAAGVAALVRATATHAGDDRPDTAVLLDADLAVLGAESGAYQAYVTGVRAEYAHVPDEAWRAGRAAVLRGFLDRASIYATATARDRWEARARANLVAELATLG